MKYVIWTAISHGHINQQINTIGSHGRIIYGKVKLQTIIGVFDRMKF